MIDDLDELITAALTDLFCTMLRMDVVRIPLEQGALNGEPHIAGVVGFTGRLTGVIYVHTTASFARRMTSALLQLPETEVAEEEMINDAMGEIANMLVGQVKSRLCDRGMPCVLTVPSVVRGNNFSVEAISSSRGCLLSFKADGKRFLIQCLLEPSDHAK
jgi:chemotaxis protein CheX